MNKKIKKCVLAIAGSDSSGGAGIQADIKAISATGSYSASVITALTAQNTQGVQGIHAIPHEFVEQQIQSVCEDMSIDAIKIGMLFNENIMQSVAHELKKYNIQHIVLDPVMIAKSGHALFDATCIDFLKEKMFPYVTLITPNIPEAEKLLNIKISHPDQQALAAKQLGDQYQINVLVKGGHLPGNTSSDVLYQPNSSTYSWFHAERIYSNNTHGTGCSLSSAIASYLAQNYKLSEAIEQAKNYLTQAMLASCAWKLGKGVGPINHFYFLE